MKILVMDDSGTVLGMMKAMLEQVGHTVMASSSGEAGLKELSGFAPDVVVCDLRMPGMNGIDVVRAIRDTSPVLPVIIFTNESDVPQAVEAMKEGAYSYVVKGSDVEGLLREIERARAHRTRLERNLALEAERKRRLNDNESP